MNATYGLIEIRSGPTGRKRWCGFGSLKKREKRPFWEEMTIF